MHHVVYVEDDAREDEDQVAVVDHRCIEVEEEACAETEAATAGDVESVDGGVGWWEECVELAEKTEGFHLWWF